MVEPYWYVSTSTPETECLMIVNTAARIPSRDTDIQLLDTRD